MSQFFFVVVVLLTLYSCHARERCKDGLARCLGNDLSSTAASFQAGLNDGAPIHGPHGGMNDR